MLLLSSSELLNGTGASWEVWGMLVICCRTIFFPFLFLMLCYLDSRSEEISKLSKQGDCRPPIPGQEVTSWEADGGWCWATGRWVFSYRWGTDTLVRDMCGPVWGRKHSLMLLTAHNSFLLIIPAHRNFFILIFLLLVVLSFSHYFFFFSLL